MAQSFIPLDQQQQRGVGAANGFRDAYQRQAQQAQQRQMQQPPPGAPPPNAQQASLQAAPPSSFGAAAPQRNFTGWANRFGQLQQKQGMGDIYGQQAANQARMVQQAQQNAASRQAIMNGFGIQSPPQNVGSVMPGTPAQQTLQAAGPDAQMPSWMQSSFQPAPDMGQQASLQASPGDPRQMWGQRFGGQRGRYIGF